MPFDVAFGMDDTTRFAWSVIFSEQETGKTYNFSTGQFEEGA
ncbi:hypothetical protein [Burkholderia gladioli]|nr:hypothetical protein [Burkholderia gladioli]